MKVIISLFALALLSHAVIGCSTNESRCSSDDDRTIVRCVNDEWVETKCGVETVCREEEHTGPFCDHEDWDHDDHWDGDHDDHWDGDHDDHWDAHDGDHHDDRHGDDDHDDDY
ncbi:hypothetical protein K493DRAFT_300675 [Basidiobolus meristosporus CBS 931.73]|uniref:Uncharacterized protein n=1 Tax=Basidiobolus meristosporus CBS 931.73 TaxID=1314790 RepID=A0A1Y1W8J2_9FUNG|nr:hypothetical protein K493DRAFT_309320 [Basidiobolus meristosporus CBS 931.73]ORX96941.1 hypothetical protein K493DRAFT_300675 [Basidiobolus meristosporus CBS 931.73]|eukprot:ORX69839.1 hypothetical protein K493DRAFT_309320 [Basidiobolus meristosporus CBS 931.73]